MGRYEDAVNSFKKTMTLDGTQPEKIAALDSAYSESPTEGYWRWCLENNPDDIPSRTAAIHAHLGDKDQAFAWLEKGYQEHDALMHQLKVHPRWDPLRDDPRFQDMLRRMNFPEYETQK